MLGFTVLAEGQTEAVKDFNGKVKGYMELQKRVSANVLQLINSEADPAKIAVGKTAAKETVKTGNPAEDASLPKVVLAVNAPYPNQAPLSSVPPSLLVNLPQYRKS